jgi:hypothetical protein
MLSRRYLADPVRKGRGRGGGGRGRGAAGDDSDYVDLEDWVAAEVVGGGNVTEEERARLVREVLTGATLTLAKDRGQRPWSQTVVQDTGQRQWSKTLVKDSGPRHWSKILVKDTGHRYWA